ncbi:hypothetical protein MIN45_P0719 [Methylomarinovum tepidoasis]|uniref:Uncharacterized protein n=1 Tax=Methylomarinovum tepidoasis TaxID=2840183 RepID=A0AAU9C7G5_9GAMM|nr:hypothetical protein [Methylomarinovum sp. IN45]BCX88350.1 hypothetical protein MIN45_P0719 [Methylomarinovum sp. IN45]
MSEAKQLWGRPLQQWLIGGGILLALIVGWALFSSEEAQYQEKDKVLARCQDNYLRGWIKRVRATGYEVKFDKDTQPILCTPYLWKPMFLEPYQPVTEVEVGGTSYKIGDKVAFDIKVEKKRYKLIAEIVDLTADGKVRLKVVDGDPLARGYYDQHIGSNYIALDRFKLTKVH